MSFIMNFIRQCTSCWQGQAYELLSKKDDADGNAEAEA